MNDTSSLFKVNLQPKRNPWILRSLISFFVLSLAGYFFCVISFSRHYLKPSIQRKFDPTKVWAEYVYKFSPVGRSSEGHLLSLDLPRGWKGPQFILDISLKTKNNVTIIEETISSAQFTMGRFIQKFQYPSVGSLSSELKIKVADVQIPETFNLENSKEIENVSKELVPDIKKERSKISLLVSPIPITYSPMSHQFFKWLSVLAGILLIVEIYQRLPKRARKQMSVSVVNTLKSIKEPQDDSFKFKN